VLKVHVPALAAARYSRHAEVTMNKTEEKSSQLLGQFRDFYGQLIEIKRLLRAETSVDVHAVGERLSAVMESQALLAGRRGTDYTGVYRQAEYVMAALADEILLHHVDWAGKNAWNNHLMEYRLFRSRTAGDEFFIRLDKLLQTPDPMYKDLATIYLMAIMLGFRGKYWGARDRENIDHYRRQLYTFIFHGQPELKSETKKLFPETYLHTVEEQSGRTIRQVRGWYILLAALIVTYLLVSRQIWNNATDELEVIAPRIEQLVR
jgi:type VI secretion system protein ImpK